MSGFVGIVNLDGAPVDRELLCRLTDSIAYRGPDAQDVWIQGNVGFGHTMLRTTFEAEREHQPCSLDGQTWITADCRVDARDELIPDLAGRGRNVDKDTTDPELILHAYAVWGQDCVQHIIGDFSFAIWDSRERRLFCARDHMGVKLFYYAQVGNCLVFGNTLRSLCNHPAVSNDLNDLAIADFLMFGFNQDIATTSFRDIKRLSPAHRMTCREREMRAEPYWTLPVDPLVRFRRYGDYVERFLDLFQTALRDRLRTNRIGILMSGGLDSSAIAAVTQKVVRGTDCELAAFTNVFDRLMPDRERYYAGVVAAHLKIPIHFRVCDEDSFYADCGDGVLSRAPDPYSIPTQGPLPSQSTLDMLARHARVALFGEGSDNALTYEWKPFARHEWQQGNYAALLKAALTFPFLFRQLPLWTRFSGSLPRRACLPGGGAPIPWLNAELVDRFGLHDRFRAISSDNFAPNFSNRLRPVGSASFRYQFWQQQFDNLDTGVTGVPVEVRHPYLDVRLLRYLLAVPAVPWCRGKYLVRRALRPYLPEEIVSRPKTGLACFPEFERWKESGLPPGLIEGAVKDRVQHYVNLLVFNSVQIDSRFQLGDKLRVYDLALFLLALDRGP